jgi:choline monooxygenase
MTVTAADTLGLPARAYSDHAWLEHETERLFERSWTLVASLDELTGAVDRLPVHVGRIPLLIVRQADGSLRAFHNMCRHRGMLLVAEPAAGPGRLRCPYHGWQYATSGELEVVPQRASQFDEGDLSTCSLAGASVEVWEGMVFAHPDPAAAPLAESLGGLPENIGSFRPGRLTQVARCEIVGDFNWKLFVENHIDVYHLWYLHEGSLGAFDHTRFEHQRLGRNWVSYEPFKAVLPDDLARLDQGTVPIGHLDDRDRCGIGAHMVFPNLLMASASEFFATYAVYPLAPGRSRVDLRIRAEPDADAAALLAATQSFISEDVFACEGVQSTVSSSRFGVGALAQDHELPITEFHQHLLAALGEPA